MKRVDQRDLRSLRPIEIVTGFHRLSEGSVLFRAGGTVVLCTASVDESLPKFIEPGEKGWLTAEYQMHPRANPRRQDRDGRGRALGGRTQEIQRLIGRSLRAAIVLEQLGPRTITIDCDVLEADGGTRTASVTGGFIALALALHKITENGLLTRPVLRDSVAAISSGVVGEEAMLDLCYIEDSRARVDLNVVATGSGTMVEVQGTAEGVPVPRSDMDALVDLALEGVRSLTKIQTDTLARAGVSLDALRAKGEL